MVPVATIRPLRMSPIRSQVASTSERMCDDNSTVVSPSARSSPSVSRKACTINGSRPEVGSSRIRTGGLDISAWMIPIFCFIPCDWSRRRRRRSTSLTSKRRSSSVRYAPGTGRLPSFAR